jgi:hypothetical protein
MLRTTQTTDHSRSLKDLVPLSQLVHDSIMACDVDVRASLLQNIVVVGNTSLTKGLTERLDVELAGLLPSVSYDIFQVSDEADEVAKDQNPFTYDTFRKEILELVGRKCTCFTWYFPPTLGYKG